jgi:hypothetical protein
MFFLRDRRKDKNRRKVKGKRKKANPPFPRPCPLATSPFVLWSFNL